MGFLYSAVVEEKPKAVPDYLVAHLGGNKYKKFDGRIYNAVQVAEKVLEKWQSNVTAKFDVTGP